MENIQDKIKKELEKVRPHLQADGGDVEFVNFDEETGILQVRMKGACVGCPMATRGTLQAIQRILREKYNPEIVVEPV